MYIKIIIVIVQICGTRQCGVYANDSRTIYYKHDSALS